MAGSRDESEIVPVDETRRRRFEAAWLRGEPEPIEACLPPPGDPAYLATLAELVQIDMEFAWKASRRAAGPSATRPPSGTAAEPPRIESYLGRFPLLNDPCWLRCLLRQERRLRVQAGEPVSQEEYRRRFPSLGDDLEGAIGPETSLRADTDGAPRRSGRPSPAASAEPRSGRFGNYEILEEIGRGGMGVVYRARQCSADRIVALKVIRREYLDSLPHDSQASVVDRFRQEALAAARLEHDHLVPVYEVGEVEGEMFYSMRYVEGRSLAEIVRHGPLENRRAAEYVESAAEAIHEAHCHGVLHRDLKPQNILIDRRTDRALVADFGLAKLTAQGDELTRSREAMGTPPYVPPEQVRDASRVTAASDVYALGATLYHALTGRPPFQAATAVETLRQVLDDEPVAPRRLNPAIDRDLETICLKCLRKEPARRYVSARALADDLGRYRQGEPIRARPVAALERSWRWCRRNRLAAVLAGLSAALLAVAVAASTLGYLSTKSALHRAEAAQRQSEESFRQAREAVDEFLTRVSENTLLNQPGMQPLRKELLEQALAYYGRFLVQRGDDPSVRDDLAATWFRVGRIIEEIQSPADSLDAYRTACGLQRTLVGERPDDAGRLHALGNTLNALGRALQRARRLDEAEEAFVEAAAVRQRLVRAAPPSAAFQRTLANTWMNLGLLEMERGRRVEARRRFEQAQTLRREVLAADPAGAGDPQTRRDLAMGHYNLATLGLADGDAAGARSDLERAIQLLEGLLRESPGDLANQHRLGLSYRILADLSSAQGDHAAALALYDGAHRRLQSLAKANPQVPEFQFALASVSLNLGELHRERGQHSQALASFRQAVEILRPLVESRPEDSSCRRDLAVALRAAGRVEASLGQREAALGHLDESVSHFRRLVDRQPEDPDLARQSAEAARELHALSRP